MPQKTALETRLSAMESRIADLREQLEAAPSGSALANMREILRSLESCRDDLIAEIETERTKPGKPPIRN